MKTEISYEPLRRVVEKVIRPVTEMDNETGSISTRVQFDTVDVSDDDYVKDLPLWEEYTLPNLVAAGVPLEQLSVNGLLSKNLDSQLNGLEVANDSLAKILKEDKSKNIE